MPHPWFHPHQIMAAPIVFGVAFLFFGRSQFSAAHMDAVRIKRPWLWLHLVTLAALLATSAYLLQAQPSPPAEDIAVAFWYAAILALVATLTASLFRLRKLGRTLLGMRTACLYAALTTAAAMSARTFVRWLWNAPQSQLGTALQASTFAGTRWLLHRFYAEVITIPGTVVLGTPRFRVQIAGTCSGIEGLTLTLVFTIGWLIFTRRELRLARALWLVPAALALSWALNLLRITALIALGDAGHPDIAINGFHSEAGWILFNLVSVGFLLAVQKLPWIRKDNTPARPITTHSTAAPYLLPFLAVLATAMLTHAASSGFDRLYPLRLAVAALALWHFRHDDRQLDWRFSWLGIAAGIAVFGMWLGIARWLGSDGTALAHSLALLQPWQRIAWIFCRILAAVITVPIIEELAFRGYLARRIVSADADSVPFARLTILAIAGSSIAFALLHGSMWFAALIAGVLFALVAKLRNRLGEALAAHATANLLLALWTLARGDYSLW